MDSRVLPPTFETGHDSPNFQSGNYPRIGEKRDEVKILKPCGYLLPFGMDAV
jgi:hypothetical protein